jgi:glucans biosynthesis protein
VVATRTERWKKPGSRMFLVDFEGGELAKLGPGDAVEGEVTVGPGARLVERQAFKNVVTGGWRLAFRVKPEIAPSQEGGKASDNRPLVEMRAFLKRGGTALTETWSYASHL